MGKIHFYAEKDFRSRVIHLMKKSFTDPFRVLWNSLATASLFFMTVTISANVLSRAFLNRSITGTIEIVGLCSVVFISVALAIAGWDHKNIKIDFLYKKLGKAKKGCCLFSVLSSIFAVGTLVYANGIRFVESLKKGENSEILANVRIYPFRFFFFMALLFLLFFVIKEFLESGKNNESNR